VGPSLLPRSRTASRGLSSVGTQRPDASPACHMRIAILGCGAVGGVIAGRLSRAGHDVTPIVSNPKIETALVHEGFRLGELDSALEKVPLTQKPVKTPQEVSGVFDLVITATPSTALDTALRDVSPFLASDGLVVTCQNGLPEDRAVAVVGDRVVGCVVGWGATMSEPGVYRRTSTGRLQIGKARPSCPPIDSVAKALEAISAVEVVGD